MSGCECKSGFFTLRSCEKSVIGRCATCKRAMCREHAVPASTTQCLDCLAKEKRAQQNPTPNRGTRGSSGRSRGGATHRSYDDDWLDERRERVRSAARAGTVGGGAAAVHHHHASGAFDRQDIEAFDDLDVERDDDDRASGGFGDS